MHRCNGCAAVCRGQYKKELAMVRGMSLFFVLALTCGVVVAQNSNSSTTGERQRTTNTNRAAKPAPEPQTEKDAAPKKTTIAAEDPGSDGVLAAFNSLLDGIRHASVNEVMGVYWNNPRLNLFNYNGSVTKGGGKVEKNRAHSYPENND